ncbi:complex I 30 kDa subunit family protein [Magnetofaba australis]|uniref:NADH-quinone oxidoreductase subunit C n=1 Tax=Magnetofaba australis IT-1 TaxID=1434232 RepID=A0A1Y2K7L9_9PROT|nr:NADH-quinone oxidoreductase subunit C [Magnetofaba australis]OSM06218.1 putative NADH-quinone oxidoreductase [Magnetofaba australis IT-1]
MISVMSQEKIDAIEELVKGRVKTAERLERLPDILVVWTTPENLLATLKTLRDDPDLNFRAYIDCTAVHWPERDKPFEIVYQLLSIHKNQRIRVKTAVAEYEPVPSATPLWFCADWFEREAYDMFGVIFSGHPDLRRILCDYDFDGHPLRKDFPVHGKWELFYDENQQRIVRKPTQLTVPNREFYG